MNSSSLPAEHSDSRLRTAGAIAAGIVAFILSSLAVQAGVTREIRDGSPAVRSISLNPDHSVTLRNFLVGQPVRFSSCFSFRLSDTDGVTQLLQDFVSLASGAQQPKGIGKEFGRIGNTSLVLVLRDTPGGKTPALKDSERESFLSREDAEQLLKCIDFLPEMEAEEAEVAAKVAN